ncbi:SpaA isopeptide-forming pilin-related protein [uncultured Catenibacterium sp.]|uniref:SpaA isopeptide-forming pilin-related protein n=1 Tax=uncultured Catenibacterium sp. TaxID=286142 RepID=UPI0025D8C1B7|nr:SpaA isopeptide-forming pilin-related protein [uncultured Catenibacterium sp.]
MTKYKTINRKKIMFIFGMALIIATTFFYINHARMDDFTSLITDATIQYQEEGAMKDYTSDVELKDNTPLSISIKATVPQGTLASTEDNEETAVKNDTLTYNLPEQLQLEDIQANKLYVEDDLENSIGSYEIKNNVLTMNFDEEHINTNAEEELKIALVLDTDSSHITYDTNGRATLLFNNKKVELNKYVEQPQETAVVQQIDEQIVKPVRNSLPTKNTTVFNVQTPSAIAEDTPTPQAGNSADFGEYITSAEVSKIENGQWVKAREFEDGDHVMVDIDYKLPAGVVDSTTKTITYDLPEGINLTDEESGIVYASNGLAVGTYHITKDGKITIHFNEEFATGEPFSGYITFNGTLSAEDAGDDGKVIFGGDGGEIIINPSEEQYDLAMSKKATLNSDGTVGYTIKASTKNGTEGTVKIEDKFASWDSATATYGKDSFTVTKVDKNGNKTKVDAIPDIKGDSFTIDNLPRLEAGESYEITYKAKATPDNVDGSGSLTNSAKGTSGETSRETSTTIQISNSMIYKHGGYDQKTDKMNWIITINPDKKDISGYVLKDTIDNGLTIPTPLTVKKSDGTTFEITSLPYTFPNDSNDTYTIEYQTDAPDDNVTVKNKSTIEKDDKTYESSADVGVKHRDWGLTKTASSQSVSDDGKTLTNTWQAYVTLPNKEITSITYSDVIKNGISVDDKDFNGEHYAILSKLRQEILANIQLKDKDGRIISNSDLNITMKFYSDEDKTKEVTADDAHVKSFVVTVKKKDNNAFIGQSLLISSYHTIADLKDVKEGINYHYVNKGIVNGKESEASVHYTKPKKLVKQGYGQVNGSSYDKYTAGKVNTNYISRNGKLYYRIIFTPDSNDDISFTDTLPKGTKLSIKDERSDYTSVGNKSNPADRGSPEAVYHSNEYTEYYCDGNGDLTDIRKYFSYEYDENTNKITFKFKSGYNRTDGDWNTGKRTNPNGPIAIYYAVDITSDDFWTDLKNESKEYTNLLEYEGKEQKQETKVERETQVVTKSGEQINNTTKVEYTVNINPAGKDLDPNSDKIVLKDELELYYQYSAYVDASSLKLYEYDSSKENNRGKVIDSSRYQVQMDTKNNILTITLPDELACVLVYQYDFDVGNAATPRIRNKVVLQGEFSSDVDTAIDTTHSEAGVVRGKMSIFKVDGKDYSRTLPGATFKLYVFNPETSQWDVKKDKNGNSEEFVTNENGEIDFAGTNKDKFLSAFNLYKVVETKAPDGYELNNTPYYFSIYQADQNKTKQDAIKEMTRRNIPTLSGIDLNTQVWFVPNNKEVSLYVPNDSNSIYVKKVWVDSENKQITNHPDSIDVKLIQNIKNPTGVNVKAKIYALDWADKENIVENKTLIVKKGGTLKITLPTQCEPSDASKNVTVVGADDYTLTTEQTWYSKVILTVKNINSDTDLKITLKNSNGNAEYEYDKDYTTSKNVYETVTLNKSNNWSYIWKNLPRQEDGNDVVYTLEEDVPSGYQVLYTNNDGILAGNITVTNKKLDNTELPDTGGFGTFGYYAIGALFITVTLFAIIAINKKKGAYGK